jgi:S-DNA-T family DNA segregation ATPase FtsK/SpoIIIE
MAAKKQPPKAKSKFIDESTSDTTPMSPHAKRIIWSVLLGTLSLILLLSVFHAAGGVGEFIFTKVLKKIFGFGAFLAPVFSIIVTYIIARSESLQTSWYEWLSLFGIFAALHGFFHLFASHVMGGGLLGKIIGGSLIKGFDMVGTFFILLALFTISIVTLFAGSIDWADMFERIKLFFARDESESSNTREDSTTMSWDELEEYEPQDEELEEDEETEEEKVVAPPPLQERVGVRSKKLDTSEELEVSFKDTNAEYAYPPLSILGKSAGKPAVGDIKAQANLIKRTLQNFGIEVEMDEVSIGPTVTRYAMKPAEGIKLSRIVALKQDLALSLAAHPIRIEAPIPGKSLVGIEIPNTVKSSVGLGSLLEEKEYQASEKNLLVALGKGVTGRAYFKDLAKMPHLLIAGTTGSGKSVTVHNIILSLLYRNSPDELRLIMVDPKRVELTLYNNIPHLLTPVIKEPKKAIMALRWAAKEMERRYDILEGHSVRDIGSYHDNIMRPWYEEHEGEELDQYPDKPEKMPYIVVIIDELADIMQAYPRELEAGIVRLAQMSRAVGIHLILSTQRPSVNVITGLIKANVPSRLALQVASQIDSRTILDAPGAEALLGKGDTLFQGSDMNKPERMQCGNVSEEEVKRVVQYIIKHNDALPDDITLMENDESISTTSGSFGSFGDDDNDDDEMYEPAKRAVIQTGKASTSYLQRKLGIGYSRAAKLIDMLEERGVVGPANGSKPREVLDGPEGQADTSYDESDE